MFRRFMKLPAWVKVMLTGRPEVEDAFVKWQPHRITPNAVQNMEDMLELLRGRLKGMGCVQTADVETAAQLMQSKSEVS